jgi:hypothetical protein
MRSIAGKDFSMIFFHRFYISSEISANSKAVWPFTLETILVPVAVCKIEFDRLWSMPVELLS